MHQHFVNCTQVETQVFDWGKLQWLSEPRVTGSDVMTTGIVHLEPGKGHDRHNHPGREEVLYVLEGKGEQRIETAEGMLCKTIQPGELVYLSAGQYHSTLNTGSTPMVLLAVYQFAGPEAELRAAADKVLPPENPAS